MTFREMMECADIAAELGPEVFVLDGGWDAVRAWDSYLGDYEANPVEFPNCIEELSSTSAPSSIPRSRAKGLAAGCPSIRESPRAPILPGFRTWSLRCPPYNSPHAAAFQSESERLDGAAVHHRG